MSLPDLQGVKEEDEADGRKDLHKGVHKYDRAL